MAKSVCRACLSQPNLNMRSNLAMWPNVVEVANPPAFNKKVFYFLNLKEEAKLLLLKFEAKNFSYPLLKEIFIEPK